MEKKRRSFYNKFEIKKGGSIEENIDKLQSELDVYLKGAEDIKTDEEEVLEKKEIKEPEKQLPLKKEKYNERIYKYKDIPEVAVKFNKKILFIPIFLFILLLGFIKFPLFKYTTTPKKDIDVPGIEIKTTFYYNILGNQLKEKTIIVVGNKEITIPISIEKWFSLSKEEKLRYIKVFQSEL